MSFLATVVMLVWYEMRSWSTYYLIDCCEPFASPSLFNFEVQISRGSSSRNSSPDLHLRPKLYRNSFAMEEIPTAESLFRPVKRRKVFRKRPEDDNDGEHVTSTVDSSAPPTIAREAVEQHSAIHQEPIESSNISEIIRARRLNKSRGHGVEFSSTSSRQVPNNLDLDYNGDTVEEESRPQGIADRFIGHTGQAVDVDKHMFVSPLHSLLLAPT